MQSRKQAFECVFAKRKSEVSLPVVFLWPDPGGSVAVRVVTTLRTRALLLTFQYIQDRSEKPVTGDTNVYPTLFLRPLWIGVVIGGGYPRRINGWEGEGVI